MNEQPYTPEEIMTLAAARRLTGSKVCFVGIGIPSAAANLARLTHAPDTVLIYESGTIGTKPSVLPLSIGDGELAETADTVVSIPEIFRYWLQGDRVDVGFLGAAQLDRFANINSTVIGDYTKPNVRLPGAGGAPEIASGAKEVCIVMSQSKRTFVQKVDFVTSAGLVRSDTETYTRTGYRYRPRTVITDLCVMASDPDTGELVLTHLHPGVTIERVRGETGWELRVADTVRETVAPTLEELATLRDLKRRTAAAHGGSMPA